jgi:hypothetical protein
MTPESWKSGARATVGKHFPAATKKLATIEELPFLRKEELNISL